MAEAATAFDHLSFFGFIHWDNPVSS